MTPKPPQDLWAQLSELRTECALVEAPQNSFTILDYMARFKVNRNAATRDIGKLRDEGKIQLVENCRRRCYVMV